MQHSDASAYKFDNSFLDFFKGKRIFITGVTGFKGSWLLKILADAGASVCGYSLKPPTEPALFGLIHGETLCEYREGDVRDFDALFSAFDSFRPEIVIHLAAQPIVRDSYLDPRYTYETNVIGTVNILECLRKTLCVKAFLNVTTDKVYRNNEWEWGYRENDVLDGYDPYSNSKSCSELVTASYCRSFFSQREDGPAVSTARAGNVIGGGDFAKDRIIPDCVRAFSESKPVKVRNPYSVRPYQHVLEPLFAYLMICRETYLDKSLAGSYNVGPDYEDAVTTGELVDKFVKLWGGASWVNLSPNFKPHEAGLLRLDCSKLKKVFRWRPRFHIDEALARVVDWSRIYFAGGDVAAEMTKEIMDYCGGE
ncbi:MAG: CDP-glucose 4,6-dehydratase [Clostridia bacterium]|nr:CDP-glucose 4,6-dehydratase [Clostridia bacterium]